MRDVLACDSTVFIVSAPTHEKIQSVFSRYGEFVPALFEGEPYYIFNCLTWEDVLETDRASYVDFSVGRKVFYFEVANRWRDCGLCRITGVHLSPILVGDEVASFLQSCDVAGLDLTVGNINPSFLREVGPSRRRTSG